MLHLQPSANIRGLYEVDGYQIERRIASFDLKIKHIAQTI